MARYCGAIPTKPKTAAAERWKTQCLLGGGSLFSTNAVWNANNVAALDRYFVNNYYDGEGDFYEKLEMQLAPTSPEVKQFAAEMMWMMQLCPNNIRPATKREMVHRIWAWSEDELDLSHELFAESVLNGIGSGGTGYNNNRWRELVYFIQLLGFWYQLPDAERSELLADGWRFAAWLERVPENDSRQLRHMLLFLLFPDNFERIFGGTDRRAAVAAFTNKSKRAVGNLSALELDKALAAIRAQQTEEHGTDDLDFYLAPLKDQWKEREKASWLFAWNPSYWEWSSLHADIKTTSTGNTVVQRWRCASTKIAVGDKAWLMRLGADPKGIMAKGNVISEPFEAPHFDEMKAAQGEVCQYVDIEFTAIRDVATDSFITLGDLQQKLKDEQRWTPQSSGIEIKKRNATLLEQLWGKLDQPAAAKRKPVTTPPEQVTKEAVNKILYGPPGTGKTHELNKLKANYITPAIAISREQWLTEELRELRWFDVITMALYALGGSAKVAEIAQHEFVQLKAKAIARTAHIKQQIWATLQTHTQVESETVKYEKRSAPLIFDKSTSSEWHLIGDWQESCEELVQQTQSLQAEQPKGDTRVRYEFVTFHQAYSYEDFIEGIRPVKDEDSGELDYQVIPGVFRRICQKAKNDLTHRYAIFIDEINRGNIAKIFGELITLVEQDKRVLYNADGQCEGGMEVTLPCSGDRFGVPRNLDIYGTMNTADRSIALLDTALRRRFNFKEMMPDSGVISGSDGDGNIDDGEGSVINLRELLDAMNQRIRFLLNRDLMLGHAYLFKVKDIAALKVALLNQFVPLMQEYFYDDWHRIQLVFRDVGQGGQKIEPQIIEHRTMNEADVLGFDHDDFEDMIDYRVAKPSAITPDAIRKIYENPA